MLYANIVHNNSPYNGVIFAEGAGSRMMMYCIFHNNQNNLFYLNLGSLEVSNSFIDHSGSFSTKSSISTSNNNSLIIIVTYQLQFFNSLHCNADIPLQQRTTEKSPMNTHEKTPMNTHEETPMSNKSSTNTLRVIFVSLSIMVLLICFVYILGLIINSKQESSNLSCSKSEIPETI